jgi:hypothetical protein
MMPHVDRHTTHFASCGCAEAEIERLGRVLHCNWCGADVHSGPLWCANCSANNPVEKDRATLEARIERLEAALETVASCFYPHKAEYPVRLEEFYIDTAKLRDAFVQARAALKGGAE